MRRVVLGSSAALCLAVGTLTACGGASSSAGGPASTSATPKAHAASPLQAVQAAYTKTSDERSMQFVMNGKFSSTGMNMTIGASGVEDVGTKAADITMTMPFMGQMEMRLVDGVMYAKIGASGTSGGDFNTGGKWLKVDDKVTADSLGTDSSFDADAMLSLLKGTSSSGVTDRGSAAIRGVQTTHYAAQLDLAKIASTEGADTDFGSLMKDTGMSSMPIDLYIDAQGRVRRLGMSMTLKDTPSASPSSSADGESDFPMSGNFSMTMDFFNFGVPVNVTAPPASEITDGSEMLKNMDLSGGTDD